MIEDDRSAPLRKARRGRVSLAAIAELAGVSPPTVSKVFNGRDGVGAETRERVEDLLRDHGYRRPPPEVATRTIEVVFHQMLGSIAMEILRGVAEVTDANGGTATFTDVRRRVDTGRPWFDGLLGRRPAGVISVVAGITAQQAGLLARDDIPLVVLDPVGDLPGVPVIGSTNWSGALAATRHLLGLGHRRIGVLTGPVKDLAARARLDGFRAALDHAEIRYDDSLERRGVFTFDDGLRLGLELLALPDPPTALVCGDDLQAMGVYEAARRSGRRIPDDLSVVGFDDIDQAAWLAPGMTTVRQPFAEMGALAARVVLGLAGDKPAGQDRFELGTTLIVRGSTAAPRPVTT